ncbi:TPA: PBSX family phage terminase large subunit [Clostridium botulinum]|uniref:PBSX family phage terminase large subunit n=1 Tax=Clostridium botulinum TaxID=1491 RepID=UPI001C9B592E|nr:PBSX family phage terminase large subunit [Clostridium botulinum]MBY6798120.1 PBSX family phage terminase large subunit [Clostridium botulinum]MBY6867906.1 PBSX family phage terminase large subunit [Clostridium botulinum]
MKRKTKAVFKFKPFSKKQRKVLNWWTESSPVKDADGIIADGAIRSGKTVSMSLSFVMWAMENFDSQNFAMCGKTVGSFRRNVWFWLKIMLLSRGYRYKDHKTENYIEISKNEKTNFFYIFGGKDEASQDLIQGITLAGIFFDEVALMPESFVNQGTGRCSIDDSKYWFNCNPDGPRHWFKTNWIDKSKKKNILYLHFTMEDNLSLSEKIKKRYRNMYTGVFFKRYISGLWVMAEGAIYGMWDEKLNTFVDEDLPLGFKSRAQRYISIDFGASNPTVFLDIWDDGDTVWVLDEYYHDNKKDGDKENSQFAEDLVKFIGSDYPRFVIIDPSAKSLKISIRKKGIRTKDADNEVIEGIRMVATMIANRKLKVHRKNCPNFLEEVSGYVWDEKATLRGEDKPVKDKDHTLDSIRYYVKTIIKPRRLAE